MFAYCVLTVTLPSAALRHCGCAHDNRKKQALPTFTAPTGWPNDKKIWTFVNRAMRHHHQLDKRFRVVNLDFLPTTHHITCPPYLTLQGASYTITFSSAESENCCILTYL